MSSPTLRFLLGLLLLAMVLAILGWFLVETWVAASRPALLAAVALSALTASFGYFQIRRALSLGNLDFMRAYFSGLALRFAFLALAGLVAWRLSDWNMTVFLTGLAVSYPIMLAYETWRVSGDWRRSTAGETNQVEN